MYTLFVGAFANILLDWAMIIGLGMGVRGAALATVASQVLSLGWAAAYFVRKMGTLRFRLKNLVPEGHTVLRMTSIGLAPFLTEISFTFVMRSLTGSPKLRSDLAISAMGIFSALTACFLPVLALRGVQPIIGYNYSAKLRQGDISQVGNFACPGLLRVRLLIVLTVPETTYASSTKATVLWRSP